MKKILALLLVLAMALSLVACGAKEETPANPADAIADEMTSQDGKYQVAFITDVGQLKDKSFNQGTYDGVKLYADENEKSYKYYQPSGGDAATDEDRIDAIKLACENGAEVVVAAGFMQGTALAATAEAYPDVHFIFIDGFPLNGSDGEVLKNVAAIYFQEEQAGYLAGYATVKEGYTKLGFMGGGGGTNPACQRFGYGFAQGAEAAAKEMGVKIDLNYSWLYGASFSASPELQTLAAGWYQNGTEVIFACGGSMFASISAAASAEDGKVVGVDSDQSFESNTVITSAMKGVAEAAMWAAGKHYAGEWDEIGGVSTGLGADGNAVGLPTDTWSMQKFTVDDYEKLFAEVVAGTVEVSSELVLAPESTDNMTVTYVE